MNQVFISEYMYMNIIIVYMNQIVFSTIPEYITKSINFDTIKGFFYS